ncbi:TVP38/TMEM64 family protein [Pseudalkalibacillus hwajinpoensis]|uniref:TVP38/TMEM64 family protein n=1 Tax=Guptibacillus hwajinpoensis TaxID=208199 RepID=UPI00325B9A0F
MISISLMILHSVVFIPSEIILFANVTLYGLWLGTLYTWIGAMLGAYLSFYLSKFLGRTFAVKMISAQRIARFDEWFQQKGVRGLFYMRLIPVFSFNLLNYGAGLTKISFWQFTWTTGVGILPPSLLMAWLYQHAMNSFLGIVLLSFFVALLMIGSYSLKKRQNDKTFYKEKS